MPEPVTIVVAALTIGAASVKLIDAIPYQKIRKLLKTKHQILLLGSSGTGKTQWLLSLDKSLHQAAISRVIRTEKGASILREVGAALLELRDTPGHGETLRRREINNAFKDEVCGIINVVSYGYHEGSIGSSLAVDENGQARPPFLTENLQREIAQLDEWSSLLGGGEAKRFLLTIVNKADLWWEQREEVLKYYREGPYAQALGEATHLGHMICFDCAFRKPFFDVVPGSGLFSEGERAQLRDAVIETLGNAIRKIK